ncbi:hypothetical protein HPB48_026589 [Haemaphysalis longicornis]|uniref:Uncharacterized protein n=1 Tax=Haemaphysalis longicornis TaxID=44386 RepID=A0A9J6HB50_HAELO|nr:hypothetical protein HPB48_026589 [Haemaphysalis longicornis]
MHLLDMGFRFDLTSRYASEDVEALFSTVRQFNGQNDQTNARATLPSLQKILLNDSYKHWFAPDQANPHRAKCKPAKMLDIAAMGESALKSREKLQT